MNKSINFTKEDIEIIEKHKKEIGVNSFSEAVRSFIRIESKNNMEEEQFALLADALMTLNDSFETMSKKINMLLQHVAPKSAGEIER